MTDTSNIQIVNAGGPKDVMDAVTKLGSANTTSTMTNDTLSSGVRVLAKAGGLSAPPWQMVSAALGQVPLRVASFWTGTKIYSTTNRTQVSCWPVKIGKTAAVEIATTGIWDNIPIGLTGSGQTDKAGIPLGANHAKIGVSTSEGSSLIIFGDMNQDGILSSPSITVCQVAQNKRGGLFFVVDNADLHDSVASPTDWWHCPNTGSDRKPKSGTLKARFAK